MRRLRASLIRLGEEAPELREDITPILAEIEEAEKEGYVNGDYGDQSLNRSFYPEEGQEPEQVIGPISPLRTRRDYVGSEISSRRRLRSRSRIRRYSRR